MRHAITSIALAFFASACGSGTPAVELTSPTTGAIVAVSNGQLAATTTDENFELGPEGACQNSGAACGNVRLIIDGQNCGVVDSGFQGDTLVIVNECPLASGAHTIKCELYDHGSKKVVAQSAEVKIEIRMSKVSDAERGECKHSRDGDCDCCKRKHDDDDCDDDDD